MNLSLNERRFANAEALNLEDGGFPSSNKPRKAEARSPIEETTKQKVRRLAVHCQRYRGAVTRLAAWQVANTLVPLAIVVAAMFATVRTHYWMTLLLAIPAAGLLIRTFIIQHDCGHGSFLTSRVLNDALGRALSVLTMAPYGLWRREHSLHHATSGNLDKRGIGDIVTRTVAEYRQMSPLQKFFYRVYRNPAFLFGLGVPAYFLFLHRLPWFHALSARESFKSVAGLNLALAAFYGPLMYVFGVSDVLWIVLPIVHIASAIGGWLFFIQHQFEETTWEQAEGWDFQVAALLGSSFYDLPKFLNWFTGNIGFHHIHHLNSMIPNYRLRACLEASPELKAINRMTLWDSFKCAGLKLWDEKSKRLVRFEEAAGLA